MWTRIGIAALALGGALGAAQTKPQPEVEIGMIVTAADHTSHAPATLGRGDLTVLDATVTDVIPFEAGKDLELYLLIDDAANYEFGGKLRELSRFVAAQPAGVPVGVAYIREGALQIAETPTGDHEKAARALRAPSGSRVSSPYCAISDLIERWATGARRREIVMVGTGIDDTATATAVCVNAETTIHDAQRAGVVIYALFNPEAAYPNEDWSKADSGMTDLAHVCYETGGEAYFRGHEPMDSMEPYLTDIAEHLAHQYLVKFRVAARPDSGYRAVFLSFPSGEHELMKPDSVWAPGTGAR